MRTDTISSQLFQVMPNLSAIPNSKIDAPESVTPRELNNS
jgi:hypothetical protein